MSNESIESNDAADAMFEVCKRRFNAIIMMTDRHHVAVALVAPFQFLITTNNVYVLYVENTNHISIVLCMSEPLSH